MTRSSQDFSLDEFLRFSTEKVHKFIAPRKLNVSLLINGTRRWYLSEHFNRPPQDSSYLPDYLNTVLIQLGNLLEMLARHGVYRVFIPVYSWQQPDRDPAAFRYLLKGIQALATHPYLLNTYRMGRFGFHYYGDASYLPDEVVSTLDQAAQRFPGEGARFQIYYGVEGGDNPHNNILRLSHEFSMACNRPPTWEDMVEMYYGDRSMTPLNILVGFNRVYARIGIPPLLDGQDRIYTMPITPLVMNEYLLRRIVYDYMFNTHDTSRDYTDLHPNEVYRLKHFYAANQGMAIGLTQKYEDLCYPLPGIDWPEEMELADAPERQFAWEHH